MIEIICSIVALVFSLIGFGFGAWACIQVIAMQRSTHKVMFLDPNKQEFEKLPDPAKMEEIGAADFDNI